MPDHSRSRDEVRKDGRNDDDERSRISLDNVQLYKRLRKTTKIVRSVSPSIHTHYERHEKPFLPQFFPASFSYRAPSPDSSLPPPPPQDDSGNLATTKHQSHRPNHTLPPPYYTGTNTDHILYPDDYSYSHDDRRNEQKPSTTAITTGTGTKIKGKNEI